MSECTRVLHVLPSLGRGGTQQYVMNLYRHIDKNVVQFDFLTLSLGRGIYEEEAKSMGAHVFHIEPFTRRPVQNMFARKRFFKERRYEIVEIHASSPLRYAYARIAKGVGTRMVIFHGHTARPGKKNFFHRYAEKQVAKYSNFKVACSRMAGEWIFGGDQYFVVPNAIDLEQFSFQNSGRQSVRQELSIDSEVVVGSVGRLVSEKNPLFLVEVFEKLREVWPHAVLLFAGEGELHQKLDAVVNSRGLSGCVHFLGDRSDVAAVLSAMDIFVMPSLYEGLSIAAVEAQASGLHCFFSSNVPRETAFSESAQFIPLSANPQTWANVIVSQYSPKRIDCLGEMRNRGYDINVAAEWMQELYLGGAHPFSLHSGNNSSENPYDDPKGTSND